MDPYHQMIGLIANIISNKTGIEPNEARLQLRFSQPPKYGDLSFPLIRYSKKIGLEVSEIYESIVNEFSSDPILSSLISEYKLVNGYLNMRINEIELSRKYFNIIRAGDSLKVPLTESPLNIVVEHTSANPVHPLHMGHARNTALGDTLARLLSARGHKVNRRFYIDDVGRQVAVAAFGVELLGERVSKLSKKYGIKPDWLLGYIYSITHLLLDIHEYTKKLEETEEDEEKIRIINERDELVSALAKVLENAPKELGDRLLDAFNKFKKQKDPLDRISDIVRSYERRLDNKVVMLIRESVQASLDGFKMTLKRLDVDFDDWDWESELVWSGLVDEILEKASRSKYRTEYKGTLALDFSGILNNEDLRVKLGLPKSLDIPPLILVRSDGTTLYTTRDIAYTIYKYRKTGADRVINVIGAGQRLPQIQIRLALYILGYMKEALNTLHYAYEIVNLPGMKMSSRKGRLLGLDTVLEETYNRALEEVEKRNPNLSKEEKDKIAWKIAVGAVRYSMISINAMRPLTYFVERATSFEGNSGPYIQYTYARANGILRKYGDINWEGIDYSAVNDPTRRKLLLLTIRIPIIAAKASDDLKPELLANYLLEVSDEFNSWYQKDSVLQEKDQGKREFKAALTLLVKESLKLGMNLIGIPETPRM